METLPFNAMIVPEHYAIVERMREGCHELCTHCHQPFTPDVFMVGVPSNVIDGQPTVPNYIMVCSEACARDWLQSYKPEPYQTPKHNHVLATTMHHQAVQIPVLPTTVPERGWIYVYRTSPGYPLSHPLRSGKWLVFLSSSTIDRYWLRIRDSVIAGNMGKCAKVSTAGSATPRGGRYVICVYTYDYEDKDDAMRIRQSLRECGILRPISYKRDLDTALLRYNTDYEPIYRA